MGFLDKLFASMAEPQENPSGEQPERGFGDKGAAGSGAGEVEAEQGQPVIGEARREDTADLRRLVMDVPLRVTVQPSKRVQTGLFWADGYEEGSQLVGFQPDRMRILIQNRDEEGYGISVYIGATPQEAVRGSGFALGAWSAVVLETQAAIYVRTNLADTEGERLPVDYIIEYGD